MMQTAKKYESLTRLLDDISGIFAVKDTLAIEMMTAYHKLEYLIRTLSA